MYKTFNLSLNVILSKCFKFLLNVFDVGFLVFYKILRFLEFGCFRSVFFADFSWFFHGFQKSASNIH